MSAKPRTNQAAIDRFAENVLSTEVGPSYEVNSIVLRGDELYHYGHHYPVAKLIRKTAKTRKGDDRWMFRSDKPGPVVAALVNAAEYRGCGGWGWNTSSVVSAARSALRSYGIPVYDVSLTGDGCGLIFTDNPDDPEPEIPELREIPVVPRKVVPRDPGPEPVKPEHGCVAGHAEVFEAERDEYLFGDTDLSVQDQAYAAGGYSCPQPGDFTVYSDSARYLKAIRAEMCGIVYGEASYEYQSSEMKTARAENPGVRFEYKQCPHCKAHEIEHRNWSALMHGGYGAHYQRVKMGWLAYCAEIDRHGGIDEWAEARKALWRLRKQRQAEHAEWMARNAIPHELIPTTRMGNVTVPVVDFETNKISVKQRDKIMARKRNEAKRRRAAARKAERERIEAERLRQVRIAEMRERMAAGEMVDETTIEWLAERNVVVENGVATLYKRVHHNTVDGTLMSHSGSPFEYKIGEWAIAHDYQPTNECGHGLHFAESPERTDRHYGSTIIECRVPIASIINMQYKVKAERAFVVRVVSDLG